MSDAGLAIGHSTRSMVSLSGSPLKALPGWHFIRCFVYFFPRERTNICEKRAETSQASLSQSQKAICERVEHESVHLSVFFVSIVTWCRCAHKICHVGLFTFSHSQMWLCPVDCQIPSSSLSKAVDWRLFFVSLSFIFLPIFVHSTSSSSLYFWPSSHFTNTFPRRSSRKTIRIQANTCPWITSHTINVSFSWLFLNSGDTAARQVIISCLCQVDWLHHKLSREFAETWLMLIFTLCFVNHVKGSPITLNLTRSLAKFKAIATLWMEKERDRKSTGHRWERMGQSLRGGQSICRRGDTPIVWCGALTPVVRIVQMIESNRSVKRGTRCDWPAGWIWWVLQDYRED